MCHQAVSLIQAELERRGIRAASITLLAEVTAAVRPPRALSVPFPVGFPLGRPSDATSQLRVVRELLRVVLADGVPLVMEMRRDGWERVDGPAVINRMDGRSRLRGTRSWARPRCNVPWSGETICMVKPCALPLPRNRSP